MNISGVKLRKDYRDKMWAHHKHNQLFGAIIPPRPATLGRKLEPTACQYATFLCSAFATALAGQYRKRMPMSSEWQSGKVSEETGSSIAHVGASPHDALKAAIVWGHCPSSFVPFTLEAVGEDWVADWTHYGPETDTAALPNHEGDYMIVFKEKTDMYDAICDAMHKEWLIHGDNASPVMLATPWYDTFNDPFPTMVDTIGHQVSEHMYTAIDFTTMNGQDWLICQTSVAVPGQNGIRYFSRNVVNQLFNHSESLAAIFTENQRMRQNIIIETIQRLIAQLRNYLFQIVK